MYLPSPINYNPITGSGKTKMDTPLIIRNGGWFGKIYA